MSNTPSQVSSLHTYFNKYLVSVEQLNRFFGNNSSQQAEDSAQVKKGVEEVLLYDLFINVYRRCRIMTIINKDKKPKHSS